MNGHHKQPKEPTWMQVSKAMTGLGWNTLRMDDKLVIFERGNQRIVARRVGDQDWEIEYYSGSAMDDTAGINDSRFAKLEAVKMGFLK